MMWRSIGSVTVLALLLVGCGGGGGGASSPPLPPPPPPATYTVGGTVSGLVGSGLTLAICTPGPPVSFRVGYSPPACRSLLQVGANGAFTLHSTYGAGYLGSDYVAITQQPSSPNQNCLVSNEAVSIQNANETNVTVVCLSPFAYVTNAADNTLSSYSVDAITGALAVVGTPITTGASPHAALSVDYGDGQRFIFVGNEGSNDVSALAVSPTTGALTAVPGSPFPAGIDPQAMTLYAGLLYVANTGSDNVSVYTIDANGALAPVSPGPSTFATGKSPTSIVADPYVLTYEDSIIYVANHGGSNDISAFRVGTGVPTPVAGSPFPAGGNPLSLALVDTAGGPFLYSANPDARNPSISGFSIDPASGALSPLSGSPFPIPVSHYMASDQTGAYLYVTSGATILGYAINASTGALTALPGFPVTAGTNAYSITIDPTNQFLYVTNSGAATVSGFKLDASTGALAPMPGSPFPAGNRPGILATF